MPLPEESKHPIVKVFYSWQSDLPNATNRGFIETALENVAKRIRKDESVKVEPVIDRDTSGIPGTPDIGGTILSKIENSDIFVCDISIINFKSRTQRKTPNPNVLIELGYALKALGPERVIMIMNNSFGKPESLPFDLRQKRVIQYFEETSNQDRSAERKKLELTLEIGLREIVSRLDQPNAKENQINPIDAAIGAVNGFQPNQLLLVRKSISWLIAELEKISPPLSDYVPGVHPDDVLVQAIDETENLVCDFSRLTAIIAAANSLEISQVIFDSFETILYNYNLPVGFSGTHTSTHHNFYKFLGHELFVTFVASLLKENRLEILSEILNQEFYVKNWGGRSQSIPFSEIYSYVELLDSRKKRLQSNRVSLHADILNARHTEGNLAQIMHIDDFTDADFFLYLRQNNTLHQDKNVYFASWFPPSVIYMRHRTPRFLLKSVNTQYAKKLLNPLGINSIEDLRTLVIEKRNTLRVSVHMFFDPFSGFDPSTIGSK